MQWLAIAKKDLKIMSKDPGAIVVLFMLPLMLMTIMSFALMPVFQGGEEESITLPVVDLDQTNESKNLIDLLDSTEGVNISLTKDDSEYSDEQVKNLVKDGDYPLALVIPTGFSEKIQSGEKLELLSYEDPAQGSMTPIISRAIEGVGQAFEVEFIVSRMVDEQVQEINEIVTDEIEQVRLEYENQMTNLANQTGNSVGAAEASAQEDTTPNLDGMKDDLVNTAKDSLNNPSITIGTYSATEGEATERPDAFQQNVPGYTVMYAFFIIMFAGRSFINERNDGTFRRILAAPVDRWQLFMGKMIPNYIIGLIQVTVLFGFGHFVFDMSLGSSFIGLVIITLSLVWASSCLGMLIAAIFKTDSQIAGWSVLLALTLAALGGTMVPLFIMPDIMQKIALITPHAWALTGYQNILVRGLGIQEIILNSVVLLSFGVVFLIISLWRMNYVK